MAVAPDGSVLIADSVNKRIRRVDPNGIITTLAGTGVRGFSGDGGPASQAQLNFPAGVAVAPDGSVLIADAGNNRIRSTSHSLPGFDSDDIAIASEDGSLLYQFNSTGRHLQTRDALTGATLLSFGYDAEGRLATITDADNNVTTIERAADGTPTAIVAPFGHSPAPPCPA